VVVALILVAVVVTVICPVEVVEAVVFLYKELFWHLI
jgi:hypothetical protein